MRSSACCSGPRSCSSSRSVSTRSLPSSAASAACWSLVMARSSGVWPWPSGRLASSGCDASRVTNAGSKPPSAAMRCRRCVPCGPSSASTSTRQFSSKARAASSLPVSIASRSGDCPRALAGLTATPGASSSSSRHKASSHAVATCKAVSPWASRRLGRIASCASSAPTISAFERSTAWCKGVLPLALVALTSRVAADSSKRTTSTSPPAAARPSAVSPLALR